MTYVAALREKGVLGSLHYRVLRSVDCFDVLELWLAGPVDL